VEPSSEDVKEVYALFGLAYYHGECLYRGLCNLYVGVHVQSGFGVSRARIEELNNEASKLTLGLIVEKLSPSISSELLLQLQRAVEKRNYLAHAFWFKEIHKLHTSEGTKSVVADLKSYAKEFRCVDVVIEQLVRRQMEKRGISEQQLEACISEVAEVPVEPYWNQRRLRKQEDVIAVYEVPIESGGRVHVFQTADQVIWELCEVGLGYSRFGIPGREWEKSAAFNQLLPALVNPRPPFTVPWNYEIAFGNAAVLQVKGLNKKNQIIFKLRNTREK